jgi:hypothetical protein
MLVPIPLRLKLIQTVINKRQSAYDLFERANHGMTPIDEQREMAAVTAFSGESRLRPHIVVVLTYNDWILAKMTEIRPELTLLRS